MWGISFLLLFVSKTSLIPPPFEHTMGYTRVSSSLLQEFFGERLEFKKPRGITCVKLEEEENKSLLTVYCSNTGKDEILYNHKFELKVYGKSGKGEGEFSSPMGISSTPTGYVYIADKNNKRVVILKNETGTLQWVKEVQKFTSPVDVEIDGTGRMWVVDEGDSSVKVFNFNGDSLFQRISFISPISIAVIGSWDRWSYYGEDFIVVIDKKGNRIQKLTLKGEMLRVFESSNLRFIDCAIDYYNNIWVIEECENIIYKFDRNLKLITKVLPKNMSVPKRIAIWRRFGQVFVLEEEGINYYWVGVDGYIKGVYPSIFDPNKEGVTFTLVTTEPSFISCKIYLNNREVRTFLQKFKTKDLMCRIVWDGLDNEGNKVGPGKYKVSFLITPSYSSRDYLQKTLSTFLLCDWRSQK